MSTWIIILLIMIVAFGPIAYLVPSKKDRRLTALRECARKEGISVALRHLPKLDADAQDRVTAGGKVKAATHTLASYQRPLTSRLRVLKPFRILLGPANRPVKEAFDKWVFDPDDDKTIPEHWSEVVELLRSWISGGVAKFPAGIQGIELDSRHLSFFWAEPMGAQESDVLEISRILGELGGAICTLDERIDSSESDENS